MSGPHLLLDFGGVVLLTPFELRSYAEVSLGLPSGSLAWQGPFEPAADPLWRSFQTGEISERDYWEARAREHRLDIKAFMRHLYDPPGDHLLRPEVMELIDRTQAVGRKVGILTNDLQAFHGREWMEAFPLFSRIEAFVDASITGVLKPHPDAYKQALLEMDEDAESVVFVDDQPINLAGSEAAGLPSVWFDVTDPAGSVAAAAASLGLD